MKNLGGNKFVALLIIISLIAVSIFSYGYIITNINHICHDKACKPCEQITYWSNSLRLISGVLLCIFVTFSFSTPILTTNGKQKYSIKHINNPVMLKVKLNN
ncbi:MAG: hypothetical protein FWF85_00290 [Clostridiales bacterium]|nr:hypothetical protein [Clostridiales bacterium]